jgi:hypothetical protein
MTSSWGRSGPAIMLQGNEAAKRKSRQLKSEINRPIACSVKSEEGTDVLEAASYLVSALCCIC